MGELSSVAYELEKAREKFPHNKHLVAALVEELGEWARSSYPEKPKNKEILQVACVALRIYSEGTSSTTSIETDLMKQLETMEIEARKVLDE